MHDGKAAGACGLQIGSLARRDDRGHGYGAPRDPCHVSDPEWFGRESAPGPSTGGQRRDGAVRNQGKPEKRDPAALPDILGSRPDPVRPSGRVRGGTTVYLGMSPT